MNALQQNVPGSQRYIRPQRYVQLIIERGQHGYDPLKHGKVEDWSAACLRGEVGRFNRASPHIAAFLSDHRGSKNFEHRLEEYLRKKFDVRGDWIAPRIEGREISVADLLIIHGPLVDNPFEREHYEAEARQKLARQQISSTEETRGEGWPD